MRGMLQQVLQWSCISLPELSHWDVQGLQAKGGKPSSFTPLVINHCPAPPSACHCSEVGSWVCSLRRKFFQSCTFLIHLYLKYYILVFESETKLASTCLMPFGLWWTPKFLSAWWRYFVLYHTWYFKNFIFTSWHKPQNLSNSCHKKSMIAFKNENENQTPSPLP